MRKFTFTGSDEDAVECPELEAFLNDIDAVCKKYGIGFEQDRRAEWPRIIIMPYGKADMSQLTDNLDDAKDGIPAVDAARKKSESLQRARYEREMQKDKAEEEAKRKALHDKMLTEGISIDGKRYKLSPG